MNGSIAVRRNGFADRVPKFVTAIKLAYAKFVKSRRAALAERDAARSLYLLDDRMLRDIGMRRDQVALIAERLARETEQ